MSTRTEQFGDHRYDVVGRRAEIDLLIDFDFSRCFRFLHKKTNHVSFFYRPFLVGNLSASLYYRHYNSTRSCTPGQLQEHSENYYLYISTDFPCSFFQPTYFSGELFQKSVKSIEQGRGKKERHYRNLCKCSWTSFS